MDINSPEFIKQVQARANLLASMGENGSTIFEMFESLQAQMSDLQKTQLQLLAIISAFAQAMNAPKG